MWRGRSRLRDGSSWISCEDVQSHWPTPLLYGRRWMQILILGTLRCALRPRASAGCRYRAACGRSQSKPHPAAGTQRPVSKGRGIAHAQARHPNGREWWLPNGERTCTNVVPLRWVGLSAALCPATGLYYLADQFFGRFSSGNQHRIRRAVGRDRRYTDSARTKEKVRRILVRLIFAT